MWVPFVKAIYVLQLIFLHTLLQDYDFYISRIV